MVGDIIADSRATSPGIRINAELAVDSSHGIAGDLRVAKSCEQPPVFTKDTVHHGTVGSYS
jgi:hypothetical protein